MIGISRAVVLLFVLVALVQPLAAEPEFMEAYMADPYRIESVEGCGNCHVNPFGAGPRNEFGLAFFEAGSFVTPMLRANWPDRFNVESVVVDDDLSFYFADPANQIVVAEINQERYEVDLRLIVNPPAPVVVAAAEPEPERLSNFNFFITSVGTGEGGNLGGLAGADRHCQTLAAGVGAGNKTWRAYLSTSINERATVNAGDRIGNGPWYNVNEVRVAKGVVDLHSPDSDLIKELALNEKGEIVNGVGDTPNQHDILTGTLSDGTAAIGMNCNNWTTSGEETNALVGHFDRQGGGDDGSSWTSAHPSRSCSQEDLVATGGNGLFYCFALDWETVPPPIGGAEGED